MPAAHRPLRAFLASLAIALGAWPLAANAQPSYEELEKPWQEGETTLPTTLRTSDLIPIELRGTNLRFGVDPQSIKVGADGVNRYVVVATSDSGAVNAMFEGVRCKTGEIKVYARYFPGGGWKPSPQADWQRLIGNGTQRHSLAIARAGMCDGTMATRKVEDIVRDLRTLNRITPGY